eukprot:6469050-Amphidinium_carterae.2
MEQLMLLIRVRKAQPNIWSVSRGCCIAKHNGKEKCQGQRVVHLLEPIGKAHAAALWRTHTGAVSDQATGFRSHRRREQTILQFQLVRWHLAQQKCGWVAPFYGQANAFASVSHQALDDMLQVCLPTATAEVLSGRHRRAMCYMQADDGEWALFALMRGPSRRCSCARQVLLRFRPMCNMMC